MVNRLWSAVALVNEIWRKGHEETSMAPWWVLQRNARTKMTKPPFLLLMPALFLGLASPVACALGLTELEQRLAAHAPSVAFQQQETRIAQSRLTQRQAESGWRLFGSVSGGRTHEIATADSTRSYSNHGYTVGASYPLLGSRSQQRLREVEAQQETVAAGARAALALDEARTRLRRALCGPGRPVSRKVGRSCADAVQARQVLGERRSWSRAALRCPDRPKLVHVGRKPPAGGAAQRAGAAGGIVAADRFVALRAGAAGAAPPGRRPETSR